VSPLRGEKPQNRPLSKLNTGRFALRAMLPVIIIIIAGLLSLGIPFDDIMGRVQLSVRLFQLHLVNKQDLKNIARDFQILKGQCVCVNDADSVAEWVKANRQDGDHLVRYIKFQGCLDTERSLRSDDFCLVIISEPQIAGLQQLYSPYCEVAMGSTHGTNAYDFQLTTLMLVALTNAVKAFQQHFVSETE